MKASGQPAIVTIAIAIGLLVLLASRVAHTDPAVQPESADDPDRARTAADVRGAPAPDQAHGRLDPLDSGDGTGRKIGRALLWIPRAPIVLAAKPVGLALYLEDRYDVVDKLHDVFHFAGGRAAIFPTALIETGFGANVGARGHITDLLGWNERISARAAFGGQYRQAATVDVDRKGTFGIGGHYELAENQRFWGYGNEPGPMAEQPLDFRIQMLRATSYVRYRLPSHLSLTAAGAVVRKRFDPTEPMPDPAVTGIDADREIAFGHGEIELAWDTRRSADPFDAPTVRGTGTLLLGFAGRQQELAGDGAGWYRVGGDLQRFVRLTAGPRVLEFRAHAELVTGDRADMPFSELPRLGGSRLLRGYETDRFRDRLAIVTQASYVWAASTWLAPSVFVDAGRVYAGVEDVSLDRVRVGYGAALDFYGRAGLLVSGQIATSIDGGVYVYLLLNPVSATRSRVRVERY